MFLNTRCRRPLNASAARAPSLERRRAPRPAKAAWKSIAIKEMVSGPPTFTLVGIATLIPVGSQSDRNGFLSLLIRNGGISPARLQSSTGAASRENGSPSAVTVLLPMKISSPSNCGPIGMLSCGVHMPSGMWMSNPPVPAVARLTPLTVTVAPRNGR